MKDDYSDIINMEHYVSPKRPRMSMLDRAAQFSSFAALTGYEDQITEEARLTGKRITDAEKTAALDEKLGKIVSGLKDGYSKDGIETSVTYFVPDKKKDGGEYTVKSGQIKKVDEIERKLVFKDGDEILFDDIYEIDIPG
ncbi:MAG: YolD-like family protein [Lachnospiraceae bacterium]|nr:YolD-like family protein [Lachnospiraceae bacterium]